MNADVRIHPDGDTLSREVARAIVFRMNETLTTTSHFTLSVAGGQTPHPAAAVRPEEGGVVWWVDEHAAKSVPRNEHETQ